MAAEHRFGRGHGGAGLVDGPIEEDVGPRAVDRELSAADHDLASGAVPGHGRRLSADQGGRPRKTPVPTSRADALAEDATPVLQGLHESGLPTSLAVNGWGGCRVMTLQRASAGVGTTERIDGKLLSAPASADYSGPAPGCTDGRLLSGARLFAGDSFSPKY